MAWRATRRRLNQSRGELARQAAQLYPAAMRAGALLAPPSWIPAAPIPLDSLRLEWAESSPVEPMDTSATLPPDFDRYTSAIGALDRPALFEDRPCYRLLDFDSRRLRFGLADYFEKLDLAEALAHELAAGGHVVRDQIDDPFDLRRRIVVPDVQTLTLRHDRSTGQTTFALHWRDPAKVATNGGIHGLVPTGEFQPAGDVEADFDLWRAIAREYAEEILGVPELSHVDYADWPFYRDLTRARRSAYFLGIGLDPLTLAASILTVVVFDSADFDALFQDAVRTNAEGRLLSGGLPFTAEAVGRFLRHEPMSAPGAGALDLAWRHRAVVLGEAPE